MLPSSRLLRLFCFTCSTWPRMLGRLRHPGWLRRPRRRHPHPLRVLQRLHRARRHHGRCLPRSWSEAVNRYNGIEVAGRKREFPVKRLLGAESIIGQGASGAHSDSLLHSFGVGGVDFKAQLHQHQRGGIIWQRRSAPPSSSSMVSRSRRRRKPHGSLDRCGRWSTAWTP